MQLRPILRCLLLAASVFLPVMTLAAADHNGVVKFGPVPVSGATVTATHADKKVITITDKTGAYSFSGLDDGVWNIQVEMLGFAPAAKDIGVASNAPAAQWSLTLLSADEIKACIQAAPAPAPPPPPASAAPVSGGTAAAAAAAPAITAPTPTPSAAAKPPAKASKNSRNTPGPTAAQAGFQRTDLTAAPDPGGAASSTPPSLAADASQSTDALVVNGSSTGAVTRAAIGNGRRGVRSLFNGGANFSLDNSVLNARNYSLLGINTPQPS